jgi:predicted alpha/beta-fold hydrolase
MNSPLTSARARCGFEAHRLLRNPHLQTVLPLLRPLPELVTRRHRVELSDGDFVDLTWCADAGVDAPVVILVPGLGGGSDSAYVLAMAASLARRNWSSVILHLRGASGEPNRLACSYHHGDTADLKYVCGLLQRSRPRSPLLALGWSLGAGVVLKMLGEEGDRTPVRAAAAISAPLRLRDCAEHLHRGMARIYERAMLLHLKRQLRLKAACVALGDVDVGAALAAQDFMTLGELYVARVNGFADAQDYCDRAACGPHLRAIARPTLVLQSADDPLLGPAALPEEERWPGWVRMEIAQHGGHVGFIAAGPWGRPVFWAEPRVSRFLASALKAT